MRRIDHAVVIGGSLAGLLAARVLSDTRRPSDSPRRRRPAGCTRAAAGRAADRPISTRSSPAAPGVVESLLPGFTTDLVAAGAPLVDLAADVAWSSPFGWMARFVRRT